MPKEAKRAQQARVVVACVGWACFLAMNSFSLWGFSLLPQTTLGADATSWWTAPLAYSNALSLFVVAFAAYRAPRVFDRDPLVAAIVLLALAIILLNGYMSLSSLPMLAVAGVCMGLGTTCCFFCWVRSFRADGPAVAKVEVVVGSALSLIPFSAFLSLDSSATVFTLGLLAFLELCALAAHRWMGQRTADGDDAPDEDGTPDGAALSTRDLVSRSWKSVLCIGMIGFMAAIVSHLSLDPVDAEGFVRQAILVHTENLCGVAVLSIVWFVLKRRAGIVSSFTVLFPVLATALLLFSFIGEAASLLIPYIGGVAFIVFSLLVIIESVSISIDAHLSVTVVYGVFAGALYCSYQAGNVVAELLDTLLLEETSVIAVTFALLYGCSLVLFAVTRKNEKAPAQPNIEKDVAVAERPEAPESPQPAEIDPVDEACRALIAQHGFSQRQAEVLTYLAHGYDVPAIAKKLYLSENTIRTHVKKIYVALDVHSRQELIELVNRPKS